MKDNAITLKTEHQDEVVLWLDSALITLASPVTITRPTGPPLTITPRPYVETYCVGLEDRADPRLAAPTRISVDLRN